jgi:hypothetical protein
MRDAPLTLAMSLSVSVASANSILRACTTHRWRSVSKHLEYIVQTGIKMGHTTHIQVFVSKLFNVVYVAKINHKYYFVYHCVAT